MTPEQHLDDIERIMGGRNGPSIQLRAQISDLQKQLAAAKEDAECAWRNTRAAEAEADEIRTNTSASASGMHTVTAINRGRRSADCARGNGKGAQR